MSRPWASFDSRTEEFGDELVEQLGAFPLHPVAGVRGHHEFGVGHGVEQHRPAGGSVDLVVAPPQHQRRGLQCLEAAVAGEVHAPQRAQGHGTRRAAQRRVGHHVRVDGGLIAQVDQLVGHRGAVVHKVCADEGFELLAAGSVAAVVGQQAFQPGGRDAPRRPDPAGSHQHQLADAVRSIQGEAQRGGAAVGVADQVGGIDAEFVEQTADHVGQVAERVGLIDALDRAAVAGHVGHDDPEMLRRARRCCASSWILPMRRGRRRAA